MPKWLRTALGLLTDLLGIGRKAGWWNQKPGPKK